MKPQQICIQEEDLYEQAELSLMSLVRAFMSAQAAVRLLDQETSTTAKETLCRYREDLERIKFWTDYLLEKNSCSSYTEEPYYESNN